MPEVRTIARRAVPAPVRAALWAASEALGTAQQRAFERVFRVSTGGQTYLDEVGASGEDRVFYDPCEWLPTRRALRAAGAAPHDVVADVGAGRGQGVLVAARLRVARVIGVEVAEPLVRAMDANLARARPRLRAGAVEAVAADALEWEVPDDLTVAFLYCPFVGDVFHRFFARLVDSHDRRPRPLRLVYVFPWEHDWLLSTGRVRVRDVLPAQWPAKPWWWRTGWVAVVYDVVPAGQGGPGVPAVRRRLWRPWRALERWSGPNGHRFRLTRDGRTVLESRPA